MCLTEACQISKFHVERWSFSLCVWLGGQRRPLSILMPCPRQTGQLFMPAPGGAVRAGGAGGAAVLSRGGSGGLVLLSVPRDAFYVTG